MKRPHPSSSSSSIFVPHDLRYIIFPPGHPHHEPPRPQSSSTSILVPHKPSHPTPPLFSSSSSTYVILPHRLIQGVYVGDNGNTLYTKNLVPAQAPLYQDEVVISVKDCDGTVVEYRQWNPSQSKLAAAILSGIQNIWIKSGSRVLVIYSRDDEQFGITISHISDLVGPEGMVYVVEASNWKTLVNMADKRFNIVPIVHINTPWRYRMLINTVDVLLAAPNRPEEFRAAYLNAMYFLETGGHYMLYVQADCVESKSRGDALFSSLRKGKEMQFKRMEQITLEPFDRDHAYVIGAFRMPEMVEPSCLETNKFWTAQNPQGHGRRLTLYEQRKKPCTSN